jgi:hypothetical protein
MGREPPAPIWAEDSLRARSCLARKPSFGTSVAVIWVEMEGQFTFVVDLACGFDEVLEMGASEEVTEVDEFAVPLVLYVDCTPAVLTCGNIAADWMLVKIDTKTRSDLTNPSMFMVCSEPTTAKGMMDLI